MAFLQACLVSDAQLSTNVFNPLRGADPWTTAIVAEGRRGVPAKSRSDFSLLGKGLRISAGQTGDCREVVVSLLFVACIIILSVS